MDINYRGVAIRKKEKDLICSCGGKTYSYGTILREGFIKVFIACYKCHLILKQYDRGIRKRINDNTQKTHG